MVATIQPIISALTGVITVEAVVGIIAAVIGITISFADLLRLLQRGGQVA